MPKKTGTAAEYVLQVLASQPDAEWRLAELVADCEKCWTEANMYNTLTRLLASGKVKKTVDGRSAWWSIASGHAAAPAPVSKGPTPAGLKRASAPVSKSPAPAPGALTVAKAPKQTKAHAASQKPPGPRSGGATAFVLQLLRAYPDYEMSVDDIYEEAERKWTKDNISNTMGRLLEKGLVTRVTDPNRAAWWSIAD